jgi:para-nitrobenzyl esterase
MRTTITYARVPARFAPPVPVNTAPADNSAPELPDGAIFPQRRGRLAWFMGDLPSRHPQHEQAFTVHVSAPDDLDEPPAAALPVLVFLHGGAWISGGGALEWHDGAALAARGMVVVTVNYRIGPLAHLAEPAALERHGPRDVVLDDLLAALRWVRDHIAGYGGDPARVTLSGQSAGSWYVHALSLMPEARGLFDRVAHLSLPDRQPWSAERLSSVSSRAAAHLSDNGWTGTLAQAPLEGLLDAGMAAIRPAALPGQAPAVGPSPAAYLPSAEPRTPDDLFSPESAAARVHVRAAYFRHTATEASVFLGEPERAATRGQVERWLATVPAGELPDGLDELLARDPYQALQAAASWRTCVRPAATLADAYATAGLPVALRRFEYASPQPGVGSGHCVDLPFQFGDRAAWADAPMLDGVDDGTFGWIAGELLTDLAAFVTAPDPALIPLLHQPGAQPVSLGRTV